MFALCARIPRSSSQIHSTFSRAPLQARHYSTERRGASFPEKIDSVFEKQAQNNSNADEMSKHSFHLLSKEQILELRCKFEAEILKYEERSGAPYGLAEKESAWQRVFQMAHQYCKELELFAQLVDSKEGEALKKSLLVEIAQMEAWDMLEEIFSDMFPDRASLNLSLPEIRPSETKGGRTILEMVGYSAELFGEVSESVLQSVFFTIWKETKSIHPQNSTETFDQLRKHVFEMRQGQLENRILSQILETRELNDDQRRGIICCVYGKRREIAQFQMQSLKQWLLLLSE